jgi:hypothetical protein
MHYSDIHLYELPRRVKRRLFAPGHVGVTIGLQVLPSAISYLTVREIAAKPKRVFGLRLPDVDQDLFRLDELAELNAYLARGGTVDLLVEVLDRAAANEETLTSVLDMLDREAKSTIALLPRASRVVVPGLEAAGTAVSLALDHGSSFPKYTGITGYDFDLDGSDMRAVCVSDCRARISPWFMVGDPRLVDVLNNDMGRRLRRGLQPLEASAQLVRAACGLTTPSQSGVSR